MILALEVGEIVAIIGIALSLLTSLFIPCYKSGKKKWDRKKQKEKERNDNLDALPSKLNDLQTENKKILKLVQDLAIKQERSDQEFERYQIQNLKYMINDAFFGYNNVHEIPYETLIVAAEGCDIYIGKGLNHEIGARCQIIFEEIQRRQALQIEGEHDD